MPHLCHEEILALISAVQQVFPSIALYFTRFRAWLQARHNKKTCRHEQVEVKS